jgi:hypothetical protein
MMTKALQVQPSNAAPRASTAFRSTLICFALTPAAYQCRTSFCASARWQYTLAAGSCIGCSCIEHKRVTICRFHGAPFEDIKRDNVADLLAYAFFYKTR